MSAENKSIAYRQTKLLALLLTGCVALVTFRVIHTKSPYFVFLVWNLFLACMPLLLSRLLRHAHERRTGIAAQLSLAAVWLIFLPNAPYIVTDWVHLRYVSTLQYAYDVLLLISCAGAGLLLGYASLFDVHAIVAKRFGETWGWMVAAASLMLSGYGVYLGRVERWNSWDVIADPRGLLTSVADCLLNPTQHLQVYALSGMFSVTLLFGYAAIRSIVRATSIRVAE